MINTGDGTAPPKVTSHADAPLDGGSTTKPAAAETVNTGTRVAAPTFEQIKAEMKAKAAGTAPKTDTPKPPVTPPKTEAPKTEAKPPETKPDATTATVDGLSDAELTTFVTASKEGRAQRAKVKALESDPHLQLGKDIAAAVAAGDHRKAAQLAKIDPSKLNDQEIAAANEAPKTPEQEELAQLRAENERLKAGKPPETQDAQRTKGRNDIAQSVIADAATFPTLAADRAAIDQALDHAESLYADITADKKRALTADETHRLFAKCLADAEASAATAKASATTDATNGIKRNQHSTPPDPPSSRQQSNSKPPSLQSSKSLSFEEARKLIWARK